MGTTALLINEDQISSSILPKQQKTKTNVCAQKRKKFGLFLKKVYISFNEWL